MYFFGYIYSASELLDPYNLSILAGAAAYIVFMSQFLLSARLRFLERRVPQDRLIALHGSAGVAAASLALIHGTLKYFLAVRYESLTLQSSLGLLALLISAILVPLSLVVFRGGRRRNASGRNQSPQYEKNRIAHNLFALAGLAAVIHVLLASSTWSVVLRGFTLLWGLLTLGAYVHHKLIRPRKVKSFPLTAVEEVTPGVNRFSFSGNIPRRSGQFAYLRFASTPPGREEHPFTLSSDADSPAEVTVRASGDFTSDLAGAPVGTEVFIDGPYGHFHNGHLPEGRPLIFLVAGIGITPVLSMARDEGVRRRHPITVLWSIATPADQKAAEPLKSLAEAGELEFQTVYTREAPEGEVFGRLDREALRPLVDTQSTAAWYLCGPPAFSTAMRGYLKSLGVPGRRIRYERFGW